MSEGVSMDRLQIHWIQEEIDVNQKKYTDKNDQLEFSLESSHVLYVLISAYELFRNNCEPVYSILLSGSEPVTLSIDRVNIEAVTVRFMEFCGESSLS